MAVYRTRDVAEVRGVTTRATVEVRTWLTIEVDDAVVDEVMSEDWRSSFYTFRTREDAIAWLAWVCDAFNGPQHVDGLAGFTDEQIKVSVADQEMETSTWDPA